jgi:hypothetical protein
VWHSDMTIPLVGRFSAQYCGSLWRTPFSFLETAGRFWLLIRSAGVMNVIDDRLFAGRTQERTIMPTFTIDRENNVTVVDSMQEIPENGEGTEIFSSAEEWNPLALKWPGTRLVEIWNSLPGVEPVQRFTSRKTAVTRIWKAIQHLKPGCGTDRRKVDGKKVGARKKASRKERPAMREGSKTARVIALLRQPKGAVSRPSCLQLGGRPTACADS